MRGLLRAGGAAVSNAEFVARHRDRRVRGVRDPPVAAPPALQGDLAVVVLQVVEQALRSERRREPIAQAVGFGPTGSAAAAGAAATTTAAGAGHGATGGGGGSVAQATSTAGNARDERTKAAGERAHGDRADDTRALSVGASRVSSPCRRHCPESPPFPCADFMVIALRVARASTRLPEIPVLSAPKCS